MGFKIQHGHALTVLRALLEKSVRCCVTSPPYWGLRDYKSEPQVWGSEPGHVWRGVLGSEPTPAMYTENIVAVFREVRRVLRDDATLWLNLGDSYAANRSYQVPSTKGGAKHSPAQGDQSSNTVPPGLKPKDLIGIPWRVAFALQADGWWLRSDIIWSKPNQMPESVTDRPTKAHEYVFLLAKSKSYYYDAAAVAEQAIGQNHHDRTGGRYTPPGQQPHTGSRKGLSGTTRNKRSVWSIATRPYKGAHFAVFPEALVEPCVLAGSTEGDCVLDPFCGSGTVGVVALRHNRRFVGIDLNPDYVRMARLRIEESLLAALD